jgi:NADH-quinone oxidoreductase subunit A
VVENFAAMALLQQTVDPKTNPLLSYIPVLMMLLGQRKPTKEKLMPYECGKDPVGSARERHSVRFYMVAMIFLLFDIEAIFLIPWAVAYGNVLAGTNDAMKIFFYAEMMVFIAILFAGLVYIWKKGVLEWNR